MILDKRTEFVSGVAIPAAAGTAVLGDVIDTSIARDLGNGEDIYWYVQQIAAGAGGTSAQFQLVSADNAALTTNPVVHDQTGVIPLANLTAGKLLYMNGLPLEGLPYKRYVGLRAVTLGTFSGGTITSGFTLDKHGWKAYPEGQN